MILIRHASNYSGHNPFKLPLAPALRLVPVAIASIAAMSLASVNARAAGTAYGVETADVGDKGDCKVEAWTSWARNGDGLATISPSCVISAMPRTEFVVQATRGRGGDEWYTSLAPITKVNLVPTAIGHFGLAIAGAPVIDVVRGDVTSVLAYVPATLRLSETFRINLNAGWINDRQNDRNFATYGAGIDWLFMPKFSMTLEGFGQFTANSLGPETRPRFQAGIRYRPVDAFSVDLIYGRNINGEGSDWLTFSSTYRFSLF